MLKTAGAAICPIARLRRVVVMPSSSSVAWSWRYPDVGCHKRRPARETSSNGYRRVNGVYPRSVQPQAPFRRTLQRPLDLASKSILRSGRVVKEAMSFTRDLLIVTEGVLTWVVALALPGPGPSAGDVVDPFASPWDEVMRAPRFADGEAGALLGASGPGRPAA